MDGPGTGSTGAHRHPEQVPSETIGRWGMSAVKSGIALPIREIAILLSNDAAPLLKMARRVCGLERRRHRIHRPRKREQGRACHRLDACRNARYTRRLASGQQPNLVPVEAIAARREAGPTVHRSLDGRDSVDGALDWAGVSPHGRPGDDGVQVATQSGDQRVEWCLGVPRATGLCRAPVPGKEVAADRLQSLLGLRTTSLESRVPRAASRTLAASAGAGEVSAVCPSPFPPENVPRIDALHRYAGSPTRASSSVHPRGGTFEDVLVRSHGQTVLVGLLSRRMWWQTGQEYRSGLSPRHPPRWRTRPPPSYQE